MKINKNDNPIERHANYDNYEVHQLILELAVGEQLEIFVDGKLIKAFVAKYVNCVMNLQFQDKGSRREPSELEKLKFQRDMMNKHIAEEEKNAAEAKAKSIL